MSGSIPGPGGRVDVAEPNVPGKPTTSTWVKVFFALLLIAIVFTWMVCASFGLPFP